MNKKILLILSFLFLGTLFAGAEVRFPFTGEATVDRVNIRAGQNENFEMLAKVDKGSLLVVNGKSYAWYKVRLPETVVAYISADYVRPVADGVGEVTADRVNVRARPDTGATILGQVERGERFFIRDDKDVPAGWIAMKPVNGLSGWVHESLIVFKSDKVEALAAPAAEVLTKPAPAKVEVVTVKPSSLKDLGNGQKAGKGRLLRAEGASAPYRIDQDETTVCFVSGPATIVDSFLGRDVEVQGTLRSGEDPSGLPVINLSKIRLLL